ncbi:MAG: succinate dehydrogenase, cytochrome b556 subunit, partial [candidate division Zixibacteria bacterium]
MKIINAFRGTMDEVKLNPNIGTWSWILHRISGLLLLFYLFTHLWVLGSANSGSEAFNARLQSVQTPLFHFLEIGLILVIFYHMVNG